MDEARAQTILNLRVVLLSGIWQPLYRKLLEAHDAVVRGERRGQFRGEMEPAQRLRDGREMQLSVVGAGR